MVNLGNELGDLRENLEAKAGDNQQGTLDSGECIDTANPVLKTQDVEVIWHNVQMSLRQTLGERVHTSWTGQLALQLQIPKREN